MLKKLLAYEKIYANTPRIDNESIWIAMLEDRNKTSHLYSEEESISYFFDFTYPQS